MKKLLAIAAVLFGALMLTSAPASAQVFVGFGGHHGGVRVQVGVPIYDNYDYNGYYAGDICGYDRWGRPVVCRRPAPVPYYNDCGYYNCGPVFVPGYGYDRYYRGRGEYRGNWNGGYGRGYHGGGRRH